MHSTGIEVRIYYFIAWPSFVYHTIISIFCSKMGVDTLWFQMPDTVIYSWLLFFFFSDSCPKSHVKY